MAVNNSSRRPGPGRRMPVEKAKDFKGTIIRLTKELKKFHTLILVSLILAIAGSVLSIFIPNRLSDLTDEISKGLVVNSDNISLLTQKVSNQMSEEEFTKIMPEILDISLSQEKIKEIYLQKI